MLNHMWPTHLVMSCLEEWHNFALMAPGHVPRLCACVHVCLGGCLKACMYVCAYVSVCL